MQGTEAQVSGNGPDPPRKDQLRWDDRMEQAYSAALERVGGLEAAKPKALLTLLAPQFPQLTLENVKWHLLAHRRRLSRHKRMEPAGITQPIKWNGRMEEAFDAVVAQLGGYARAKPKAMLKLLQAQFPELTLTLQHIRGHLQRQRAKEMPGAAQLGQQVAVAEVQVEENDAAVPKQMCSSWLQQQPQLQLEEPRHMPPPLLSSGQSLDAEKSSRHHEEQSRQQEQDCSCSAEAAWLEQLVDSTRRAMWTAHHRLQLYWRTHQQIQQSATQLQFLVKHMQELLPSGLADGRPASQQQIASQLPPELVIAAQQLLHSCPSAAALQPLAGSSQHSVSESAQPTLASQNSRQQRVFAAIAPSFSLTQNAAAAALARGLQQVPAVRDWGNGGGSAHLATCRVLGCRICDFELQLKAERQEDEPVSTAILPTSAASSCLLTRSDMV